MLAPPIEEGRKACPGFQFQVLTMPPGPIDEGLGRLVQILQTGQGNQQRLQVTWKNGACSVLPPITTR